MKILKMLDRSYFIYFNKLTNKKNFSENLKSQTNNFKFQSGVSKIPHFSKRDKGGEDAYTVTDHLICVADGVGGWNDHGVDPAKYSNELCNNIKLEYTSNFIKNFMSPKALFVNAASKTKSTGSSTFCMVSLDLEKKYLHSVNLGDSGYMIIRNQNQDITKLNTANTENTNTTAIEHDYKMVFKSEEQQHSFNFPFQCGTSGDNPNQAVTNVHEFQENDLIILATDGLWDNLYEQQILSLVERFYKIAKDKTDLNLLAEFIAKTAEQISLDQKYKSPFCQRSGNLYLGGKPDDVTVVVSQIVQLDFNPKF